MAATTPELPEALFRGAEANALAEKLELVTGFLEDADPATTRKTSETRSTLTGAYTVRTRIGPHEVVTDQPSTVGGHDSAASPVGLTLAALGSCQAVTYRLWALKLGIELHSIWVDVEADFDPRGLLGVDGAAPAQIRVSVNLEGPEPGRYPELREAVDAHCPVLDLIRSPCDVRTAV